MVSICTPGETRDSKLLNKRIPKKQGLAEEGIERIEADPSESLPEGKETAILGYYQERGCENERG